MLDYEYPTKILSELGHVQYNSEKCGKSGLVNNKQPRTLFEPRTE